MASIHGFSDGSFDYKHMYQIADRRGPFPRPEIHAGTPLSILRDVYPAYFAFVADTPLSRILNSTQATLSLFVPRAISPEAQALPSSLRYRIALRHILPKAYPPVFVMRSRAINIATYQTGETIRIDNGVIEGGIAIENAIPVKHPSAQFVIYEIPSLIPGVYANPLYHTGN